MTQANFSISLKGQAPAEADEKVCRMRQKAIGKVNFSLKKEAQARLSCQANAPSAGHLYLLIFFRIDPLKFSSSSFSSIIVFSYFCIYKIKLQKSRNETQIFKLASLLSGYTSWASGLMLAGLASPEQGSENINNARLMASSAAAKRHKRLISSVHHKREQGKVCSFSPKKAIVARQDNKGWPACHRKSE